MFAEHPQLEVGVEMGADCGQNSEEDLALLICRAIPSSVPSSEETTLPRYTNCSTHLMFCSLIQIERVGSLVRLTTLVLLISIFSGQLPSAWEEDKKILKEINRRCAPSLKAKKSNVVNGTTF